MDYSVEMDASGRLRHDSIIKSAERNKDSQKKNSRVSFHTHREVQKFNSEEERLEVTQEKMTPTKLSLSDSSSEQMSASVVNEMVFNVSLADESISLFDGPQAVSTPLCMTRIRPPTPAVHRTGDPSLRESAISAQNAIGNTTVKLFNYIKRYNDRQASFNEEFMPKQDIENEYDQTTTVFLENNCDNFVTNEVEIDDDAMDVETQTCPLGVRHVSDEHEHEVEGLPSEDGINLNVIKSGHVIEYAAVRHYLTPTSTPRSRPASQRKPPRRTIDRTWLIDFEDMDESSQLLLDIDIEASMSNAKAISIGSTTAEESAVLPKITSPESANSQKRMKTESFPTVVLKKRPNLPKNETTTFLQEAERVVPDDLHRSICAIDASLMDSLLRLRQPRHSRGFSPPGDSSLNCSFKSSSGLRVSSEEEFNATVLDDETLEIEWLTIQATRERKRKIFGLMETIMDRRAQLSDMEARLNNDLLQSFRAVSAKMTLTD